MFRMELRRSGNTNSTPKFHGRSYHNSLQTKLAKLKCSSVRDIFLFSVANKKITWRLLNRLVIHITENLNWDTTVISSALRQKRKTAGKKLVLISFKLTKTSKTVGKTTLWVIVAQNGCPSKIYHRDHPTTRGAA